MSNYPCIEWGGEMKRSIETEIERVEKLMKAAKNSVMYRKYLVIHLHLKGYSNLAIADMVGLNKNTIGIYINAYAAKGADGLIPKKSPGRPRFLTEEQEQFLYRTVSEKTPDDVGYSGIMNWTAKIACLWAEKEFGVKYHVNGMLDMFHRLKLSYTRPTYVLAKANPERQEQFKKDFEELKKTLKRLY